LLNRRAIRDLLMATARAAVVRTNAMATATKDTPAPPVLPPVATDDLPPATARVLVYLRANGGREPVGVFAELKGHRPHLTFQKPYVVLCPEAGEDVRVMRDDLEEGGCTVIVVKADREVGPQLERWTFWRA
jgi:hypothetical protein